MKRRIIAAVLGICLLLICVGGCGSVQEEPWPPKLRAPELKIVYEYGDPRAGQEIAPHSTVYYEYDGKTHGPEMRVSKNATDYHKYEFYIGYYYKTKFDGYATFEITVVTQRPVEKGTYHYFVYYGDSDLLQGAYLTVTVVIE